MGGTIARLERTTLVAAVLAMLATVAFTAVPELQFAYRSDESHVALEACAALIAVLAAVLVAQRFRRTRSPRDLILAFGLGVLAGSNQFLALLPVLIGSAPSVFSTWGHLIAAATGLAVLAAGAFARGSPPVPWRRGRWLLRVGPLAVIAVVVAAMLAIDPAVPEPFDPRDSASPRLNGPLGPQLIQVLAACLCVVAAIGFRRRARAESDELLAWFALAMTLSAFSRLNYCLYPSLLAQWVYTGDVFRLAAYGTILIGSLREIEGYQPKLMRAAVTEDRRRIARDLHDGMAQEVAFILGLVKTKVEEDGWDDDLASLRAAAERALSESREAITALGHPEDESFAALLGDTARLVAARSGARLHFQMAADAEVPYDIGEALLRITREAVTNATRHGDAKGIVVRVWNDGALHLSITDDGAGFEAQEPVGGMGLANMRERAEALGGAFRLKSAPGHGTEILVTLPQISR